ncbi:MAG: DUF1799 domain-containing protein [Pseudomonadaceae bacterium]|nr:DUF1799 domain-containing protein [Pseudomonadaceae bacterium]
MSAFGFLASDFADDALGIWPDNWQPLQVFSAMGTQWRSGMNGPTGLDYGVLREVMAFERVPKADRQDVYDCIRVMETAALSEIHKKD